MSGTLGFYMLRFNE
jgi:hypothetical protein